MSLKISEDTSDEYSYVVTGATLSCSYGDAPSILKAPKSHGVFLKGKPKMNIMDYKSNVNVMPFGMCSSMSNPAVASATAANYGNLTPMPCTPVITMPWINGKDDNLVENKPSLLSISTNSCIYCGDIIIEDDGQ